MFGGPRQGLPDGERFCGLVTCTRLRRCVRFAPKYSAAPLRSFFLRTRLFSKHVSQSSTATSPTVSAIRVTVARFMLGYNPGRWISSSR